MGGEPPPDVLGGGAALQRQTSPPLAFCLVCFAVRRPWPHGTSGIPPLCEAWGSLPGPAPTHRAVEGGRARGLAVVCRYRRREDRPCGRQDLGSHESRSHESSSRESPGHESRVGPAMGRRSIRDGRRRRRDPDPDRHPWPSGLGRRAHAITVPASAWSKDVATYETSRSRLSGSATVRTHMGSRTRVLTLSRATARQPGRICIVACRLVGGASRIIVRPCTSSGPQAAALRQTPSPHRPGKRLERALIADHFQATRLGHPWVSASIPSAPHGSHPSMHAASETRVMPADDPR